MKRSTLVGAAGGLLAGVALATVAFVAAPSWAFRDQPGIWGQIASRVTPAGIQPVKWGQPANLADLVEQVSPSVVQIVVRQPGRTMQMSSPFDQFRQFGFPFGDDERQPQRPRQTPDAMASGSGFIIDSRGYIVTNNHVVDSATRVTVKFTDGREAEAKVIGVDKKTDLAVIKIAPDKLPATLSWGDSDQARPGENIFAIGAPFGLGNTVTSGIVSARGRDIGSGPYDDYIQVDAPINSGNSGGPLFNAQGQVIGVNSAIYSPSGGNVGIGFSIPSNLAHKVIAEIIEHGTVARGWLGVSIGDVDRATADSIGLRDAGGALVQDVTEGSPAAKAGLRVGDVVLAIGDRQVKDVHDLTRAVADTPAGQSRDMRVFREGREQTVKVTIAALKDDAPASAPRSRLSGGSDGSDDSGGPSVEVPSLGLELQDDGGAVVSDVDVHSAAYDAGLRPGDKILRVGQVDVKSAAAASKAIADEKGKRGAVLLQLERAGPDGKPVRRLVGVPFGKS